MSDRSMEPKWAGFIFLSLLLHMGILSLILFSPDPFPSRRMSGPTVYEVNLVSLPAAKPKTPAKTISSKSAAKALPATKKKAAPAKRISAPPVKKKAVIIAKRTVERKKKPPKPKPKPKKRKVSPTQLIDQAVAKIKRTKRIQKRKNQHLERAISKLQKNVSESEKAGSGGGPVEGFAIRIYQMEVEERIKSNWQYPVNLTSPSKRNDLVATVVVKVSQDGTLLKSWFMDRSGNGIFDASVMKAVERSNPLPPFPDGYNKRQDEVEVRFNLSELEEN